MNQNNPNDKTTEETKDNQTPQETEKSIMPTMLDTEELEEKKSKRDLSAIIPTFDNSNTNADVINSKESELKSDGSVIIGTITNESYTVTPNAVLPESIDISERKLEAQRNKNKKKKDNRPKKTTSKAQGYTAIGALIVIIGLVGFWFYYKNAPKDTDFKTYNITIELGKPLPIRGEEYVKPAKGNEVDELAYAIDTSNVKIDEVGEYEYTVTYKNVSRTGKIIVEDTTGPTFETQPVTIKAGKSINPSQFIKPSSCHDPSGCNYKFEEEGMENRYTTSGVYTIPIIAYDAYENQTLKNATLTIIDVIKYYRKNLSTPEYTEDEDYELHFDDIYDRSILLSGIYTQVKKYNNPATYEVEKEKIIGEQPTYKYDDETYTITKTEYITSVGLGYTDYSYINPYLINESFIEYQK